MMPVRRAPPGGHPEPIYGQAMQRGRGPQKATAQTQHIPLAKCRVLYLGSAVPLETANGIEALQQPLRERFPITTGSRDIPGIDVRLMAFSSGLQMQYVDDPNSVVYFPIQSLHVCAAVKASTGGYGGAMGTEKVRFVPLDSPEGESSNHPPMFACIMRRTKGVKVLECHMFIAKSKVAAMALVQSCTHAYEHKELWREDAPPIDQPQNNETHLVPADPSAQAPDASPEFFEQPPPQGYYYSSSKDLVRNYNVHGGNRGPMSVQGRPLPARPPPQMMMPPPPQMRMQPYPHPYMLPPPPADYFKDWDTSGRGVHPIAVFPGGPYLADEYEGRRRHRQRHRSPTKERHRGRKSKRPPMSPPRRRYLSPGPPRPRPMSPPREQHYQQHLSPSPGHYQRRAYSDGYSYSNSGSSASGERNHDPRHDTYYSGRALTPPADYDAYYGRAKSGPRERFPNAYDRKDQSDLIMYAPRYMREMPSREGRHHPPRQEFEEPDNYYDDGAPSAYGNMERALGYWP